MNLNEIVNLQREFDKKHGWTEENENFKNTIDLINKDIVGMIGELGEFSNLIKKINLEIDAGKVQESIEKFQVNKNNLSEEIVDIFIYLIRIAGHLKIDFENTYKNKFDYNKKKYKRFIKDE